MEELKKEGEEKGENRGGGVGVGVGLHLALPLEPRSRVLDRALFSFPLSALFTFLGCGEQSRQMRRDALRMLAEAGLESVAAVAVAAVALSLAGLFESDERHCHPSAQLGFSYVARHRALPAKNDGLRILSPREEPLANVIHGASVGRAPVLGATGETGSIGVNAEDNESEKEQWEMRHEIERLRNLSDSLLDRVGELELQLLEYYGMEEQEAAVRELESRLGAASTEARQLGFQVESLQEENQSLRAQLSELVRAKGKVESTIAKVELVRRQVRSDWERIVGWTAALEAADAEGECWLAKTAELEREAAELRTANASLQDENSELALRLQNAQQIVSSVNVVLEGAGRLRETNKKLFQELEQLRGAHCAFVEERVYLKWVNACLRYELRNCQPSEGHIGAKDLSKSMSHRSSERAKQLMLEYHIDGFDIDAIIEQPDDEPEPRTAVPATRSSEQNKPKFLSKIKKLVAGRAQHRSKKPPGHDVLGSNPYGDRRSSCPATAAHTPASSVATAESRGAGECGPTSATVPASPRLEAGTARSRSDLGPPHGREVRRYHALRPEHPAELDGFHALEWH